MANELNLPYSQTGLIVTAQLAVGTAYVGSAIACPELPAGSGRYSGDVPNGTAAGTYDVLFKSGGVNIGGGPLHWDGTAEINIRTLNNRVGNIPTNPLLTTDGRMTTIVNDLDSLEIAAASILQDTSIDIPAAISAIPSAPASADIYAYFTASDREDQFKADLGPTNTAIDNLAAAIGGIPAAPAPSDIYSYFIGENREDAFKADLTDLENAVEAIAILVAEIQGTGFDTTTDSLDAIRARGDSAWITANLAATNNAIANLAIALGLIASDVDSLESQAAAILQDTSIDIPGLIGALPAPNNSAIETIQTQVGEIHEFEGLAGWTEAKAPTLAEPGQVLTEGGMEFTITQALDGTERMERVS